VGLNRHPFSGVSRSYSAGGLANLRAQQPPIDKPIDLGGQPGYQGDIDRFPSDHRVESAITACRAHRRQFVFVSKIAISAFGR
jgi:hypothetical protein